MQTMAQAMCRLTSSEEDLLQVMKDIGPTSVRDHEIVSFTLRVRHVTGVEMSWSHKSGADIRYNG